MSEEETRPKNEEEKPTGISFLELLGVFFNQGAISLGAAPHPATGKVLISFEGAQESISVLELLKEKTEGNLSPDESKALTTMTDELKMAFVHAVNDPMAREMAEKMKEEAEQAGVEPSRILTPDGRPAASADAGPTIILP